MRIHIKNLRLKTIVGVNDWEREQKQEVVVNMALEFDGDRAAQTDRIEDTINYKTLVKRILEEIEQSDVSLLEKLARRVLDIALEDERVKKATVEVDKPHALRFADSVSVSCTGERKP